MRQVFHKKTRFKVLAGLLAALMLFLILLAFLQEGPEGFFLPAALIAAALLVLLVMLMPFPGGKRGPGRFFSSLLQLLLLILSPAAAVLILQNFTLDPFRIYPYMLAANCVFYYLVYLFASFVLGAFSAGYVVADLIFLLLGTANYFVVQFRGSPIVPWDLFSIGTAASVANNYTYEVTWRFVFSAFCFLALIVFHMKLSWKIRSMALRIIGALLAAGLFLFCTSQLQKAEVKEKLGMDVTLFTPNVRYRNNGFLAAFIGNLHLIRVQEPDGYSTQKVEEISDEIGEEYGSLNAANTKEAAKSKLEEGRLPNIIVIIDEAFSDLKEIGDFETDIDYMPHFRALMEQCDSGKIMVSVKGGNTANTEYEFLSGDTMAFLPAGSVVYQQFIRDTIPVLPSYLASLGYTTTAIHPYLATGWDRNKVFPLFGFHEFLSQDDFESPEKIRLYISDESAFDKILEQLEKDDDDTPQFIYEVTMQNHSGYSKEYPGFTEKVHLKGLAYENTQTKAVEKYLTLIYESDQALGKLMESLSQTDEPTILLMFGDHQPSDYITNVIERLVGYDPEKSLEEAQKTYVVPFFVWNNFGMQMDLPPMLSLNYLAADILKSASLPLTRYHQFLLSLQEKLPVICAGAYIDQNGTYHTYDEENPDAQELLNRYNILQYNHMTDIKNRVTDFFALPAGDVDS